MSRSGRSGYYDRGHAAETVICDDCAVKRWGDPFEGDGDAAFNARCADTSGDWCWAPWWRAEQVCTSCGGSLDARGG